MILSSESTSCYSCARAVAYYIGGPAETPEKHCRDTYKAMALPEGAKRHLLNSRRLTAAQLQWLAETLDLPTNSPTEDLRPIIDGKLTEQDREPQNVQVAVHEVSGVQVRLYLVDGTGVFHESEPLFRSQQAVPEQQKQFADLQEALADATRQNEALIGRLEEQQAELDGLQQALEQAQAEWALERQQAESRSSETTPTQEELVKLQDLQAEKERTRQIWRMNCQQLAEYDGALTAKDQEIAELKTRLQQQAQPQAPPSQQENDTARAHQRDSIQPTDPERGEVRARLDSTPPTPPSAQRRQAETDIHPDTQEGITRRRRGRAPPIDPFTGEDLEIRFDDWLPSLQRASQWNQWTEGEQLMQLAGHLRGRARQEWNLITRDQQLTLSEVTQALRSRLEPPARALAAQEFRHTYQRDSESVSDVIRRLERTFMLAYGQDAMSLETRETLLHGQLQECLRHHLMRAPAVSGALTYKELCMAAKNEEKRQAELKKRQEYQNQNSFSPQAARPPKRTTNIEPSGQGRSGPQSPLRSENGLQLWENRPPLQKLPSPEIRKQWSQSRIGDREEAHQY